MLLNVFFRLESKGEQKQLLIRNINPMASLDQARERIKSLRARRCPIANSPKVPRCFIISSSDSKWWHKRSECRHREWNFLIHPFASFPRDHFDIKPVHSDDSDDETPAGGDYTVYECPGLAPVSRFRNRHFHSIGFSRLGKWKCVIHCSLNLTRPLIQLDRHRIQRRIATIRSCRVPKDHSRRHQNRGSYHEMIVHTKKEHLPSIVSPCFSSPSVYRIVYG